MLSSHTFVFRVALQPVATWGQRAGFMPAAALFFLYKPDFLKKVFGDHSYSGLG